MSKLSIIMSVYNSECYVNKSVESILTQTFKNFEFIIINDGSTDKSLEILEYYARQDNRIKLINQENIGLVKSLNKGLKISQGNFIARMDADDISKPERFEKQIEYLKNHPNCVIVGCEVLQIDMDGAPICNMGIPLSHEEIDAGLLLGRGGDIRHPAVMMRRDAVLKLGGYREQFKTAEDLDLFLRLAEQGKLANLSDILLEYRLHLGSVNFSKSEQQRQEVITVLEEAYARRSLEIPEKVVAMANHSRQLTPAYHHRNWSEAAFLAGYYSTARKHTLLALQKAPFSLDTYKFLYRGIRRSIKSLKVLNCS
jgi:glycosyltransferase involved in cell wall biosynthesis